MTKYLFRISNGGTSSDTEELPNDEAAWRLAVNTVRDIESALSSCGGHWSIVVDREDKAIFRIDVRAQRLG
jgi:uncharacterized protein DUF6894